MNVTIFAIAIALIELIIIIFLLLHVANLHKLHYSEFKEIIRRINVPGIELNDTKPGKITNIIKNRMKQIENNNKGGVK